MAAVTELVLSAVVTVRLAGVQSFRRCVEICRLVPPVEGQKIRARLLSVDANKGFIDLEAAH